MDVRQFRDEFPGELVPIVLWGHSDAAFVPAPLPPEWRPDEKLWPLLVEAGAKLSLLEGVGRSIRFPEILLQPAERREAIQSSRIEGTIATPRELLLADLTDEPPARSALREVANCQRALEYLRQTPLPVSQRLMRELHSRLMDGVSTNADPGEFRKVAVVIGPGTRYVAPPIDRLDGCLKNLEEFAHAENRPSPLADCFLWHYQFEAIHPFRDGNGRVGRMLLSAMIQQKYSLTCPWIMLSDHFARHRSRYIDLLYNVSTQGAWNEWVHFCVEGVIDVTRRAIERFDQLRSLQDNYREVIQRSRRNARLLDVIDLLFRNPMIRIPRVAEITRVTIPTASKDVQWLVGQQILEEIHGIPRRTFLARAVYQIAYGDLDT